MSTVFRLLLLAGLLVCAVATALVKKPLRAVIIYMAYSIIMSVIWILLEAPDLALTEAGRRRRHHRHPVLPDAAAYRPHRPGCRRGGDPRRGGTP